MGERAGGVGKFALPFVVSRPIPSSLDNKGARGNEACQTRQPEVPVESFPKSGSPTRPSIPPWPISGANRVDGRAAASSALLSETDQLAQRIPPMLAFLWLHPEKTKASRRAREGNSRGDSVVASGLSRVLQGPEGHWEKPTAC